MAICQPRDRRVHLLMRLTIDQDRVSSARLVRDPEDGERHLLAISFEPPSDLFTAVDTFCGYVQKQLPHVDGIRYVIRLTGR